MEHTGETLEILVAKGVILTQNHQYDLAESVFLESLKKYPESMDPLPLLCELYYVTQKQKKIKEFLNQYGGSLEYLPISNFLTVARLYWLIGQNDQANFFITKYVEVYGTKNL